MMNRATQLLCTPQQQITYSKFPHPPYGHLLPRYGKKGKLNSSYLEGFSLIELLIVFVIIGILTTITYPAYQHYIIRAHRNDGQTALLDLAIRMERYYSENNSYQHATIGTGYETDILSSQESNGGWYILSITHASDDDYTLQATPINMQARSDIQCQSFTLNSSGAKNITTGPNGIPTGTSAQCW